MNTTTAQMYDRKTRANNTKKRGILTGSNSRSRSKESGSVSKRDFKYGKAKSPLKSPLNSHYKSSGNNVVVHPTRNESVKRMFKNINRDKKNLYSIRKKINMTDSKQKGQKQAAKVDYDRSLGSQGIKDYIKKNQNESGFKATHNESYNMAQKAKPRYDQIIDLHLNQNQNQNQMNSELVSRTYTQKEPKTKIEMIKSSGHQGDTSGNSEHLGVDKSNPNISNFEHKRASIENNDGEPVPKIEISLNDARKKQKLKSHNKSRDIQYAQNEQSERIMNQNFDDSSLNKDLMAYMQNSSELLNPDSHAKSQQIGVISDLKRVEKSNLAKKTKAATSRKIGLNPSSKSHASLNNSQKVSKPDKAKLRSIDSIGMEVASDKNSNQNQVASAYKVNKKEQSQTLESLDFKPDHSVSKLMQVCMDIKEIYIKNMNNGMYDTQDAPDKSLREQVYDVIFDNR